MQGKGLAKTRAPFDSLNNPIFSHSRWSVKDACVIQHHDLYHLFFSLFFYQKGRLRCHVAEVTTPDFKAFSSLVLRLREGEGYAGFCSPDITLTDEGYCLTYNAWGDAAGKPNQIFYRLSEDCLHWSEARPLAQNLTLGKRAIDGAVVQCKNRVLLMWKERMSGMDRTRLAKADSISDEFEFVGNGNPQLLMTGGTDNGLVHENYCFFHNKETLRLLTTDYLPGSYAHHRPCIYSLAGPEEDDTSLLHWQDGYHPQITGQQWNSAHHANAAFLFPAGEDFYLLYAGNRENKTFWERGHNRLGLAFSGDLMQFDPLPDK